MIPPMAHAAKKMVGVPAFAAMVAGVLNIPIPITKLITIMVRLKRLSCCLRIQLVLVVKIVGILYCSIIINKQSRWRYNSSDPPLIEKGAYLIALGGHLNELGHHLKEKGTHLIVLGGYLNELGDHLNEKGTLLIVLGGYLNELGDHLIEKGAHLIVLGGYRNRLVLYFQFPGSHTQF